MTRARTPLEAATGKLIAAVQKEWNSELGEPRSTESEQVMSDCHKLHSSGENRKIEVILEKDTVTDFLGARWVKDLHPSKFG